MVSDIRGGHAKYSNVKISAGARTGVLCKSRAFILDQRNGLHGAKAFPFPRADVVKSVVLAPNFPAIIGPKFAFGVDMIKGDGDIFGTQPVPA